MKKPLKIIMIILLAAAIFIISPLSKYVTSLAVMSVYSGMHERESLMAEKDIEIHIPGGLSTKEADWYPFVMTFNPGGSFGYFAGERNLKLTILYNFPSFDLSKGCSHLYDPDSPYYNGFYGAYLLSGRKVSEGEAPYGFNEDGTVDTSEIALVPRYDFERLVLGDFGIKSEQLAFRWEETSVQPGVDFIGYEGWTRIEAKLSVNSTLHRKNGFVQSYLQYGVPNYDMTYKDDFELTNMKGVIYARYFEEKDVSVFFYVLAENETVIENCEKEILGKSLLEKVS